MHTFLFEKGGNINEKMIYDRNLGSVIGDRFKQLPTHVMTSTEY